MAYRGGGRHDVMSGVSRVRGMAGKAKVWDFSSLMEAGQLWD